LIHPQSVYSNVDGSHRFWDNALTDPMQEAAMRSTIFRRPALSRLGALFTSLALLVVAVSGKGPSKRDKADLTSARRFMAEKQWTAARGAFDAAGQAISDHRRSEIRDALRGAVRCSLELGDISGAWERTKLFWRNRTGADLKESPHYEEHRDYPWIVPNLELVRQLIIELGAAAKPELRHELERRRIDVDWQLLERLLGQYFSSDDDWNPFPNWWWDPEAPGGNANLNVTGGWSSVPEEGLPLGPDGRPRFLRAPKEYRPAGGRADNVLALLAEVEAIDATPSREHAARALLTQARIRRRLYGPSSDPAWSHAEFYYTYARRPTFFRSYTGRGGTPFWKLRDNQARTLVAGRTQVIDLPQGENPLALLRLLQRKYPNSPSVPEALYQTGVYHQMRQQFDRAFAQYRALRARFPKHPRAALAQKKINTILHPDVLLGRTGFSLAGTRPKLWVAHRKTERVDFTARSFDLSRYVDRQAKKGTEPWRLSYLSLNFPLSQGRGDTEEMQKELAPYLGKEVIRWSARVPMSDHVTTQAIEAPLTNVGAYIVEASVPGRKEPSRILVILSDLVLVRKSLPAKSHFYTADARTGRPVAGQTVRFYTQKDGDWQETTRKTNGDGVIEIALKSGSYGVTALAISPKGGMAVARFESQRSSDADEPAEEVGHAVTDRPIYQPGDTVHFRLWVRELAGRVYRQPLANQPVSVQICDPQRNFLHTLALRTDAAGGVAGEYVLSPEAALGEYSIGIVPKVRGYMESLAEFRVEMYRKPEFEVKVEPREKVVRPGGRARIRVSARYYWSGAVRGGHVHYEVFSEGKPAAPSRPQAYDWLYGSGYGLRHSSYPWLEEAVADDGPGEDEEQYRRYGGERRVSLLRGNARLGDDGTLDIDIDTAILGGSERLLTIEAEVRDLSRRTIRGKGNLVVARQDRLATLELDRGWYRPGERPRVSVALQTASGPGVAASGSIRLSRIHYEGAGLQRIRLEKVHERNTTTGPDGRAILDLPAVAEGQYRLEFICRDSRGEPVSARTVYLVHGPRFKAAQFRHPDIEIIPDRPTYKVGETAHLLVHVRQPKARVLWSDDARDGDLLNHRFMDVADHVAVIPVRIEERHVPNFFVEATVVSRGQTHTQACEILVPPVRDLLDVLISTTKPVYRPGEAGSIKVSVTDSAGKPVSGPITLTAYDKAITYIQDETGIGPRTLLVKRLSQHSTSVGRYSDSWSFEGEGAFVCPEFEIYDDGHQRVFGIGGASPQGGDPADVQAAARSRASREPAERREPAVKKDPVVRRHFADTALWRAALALGPDGTATTKVIWPDSLTTWRLRAYALTRTTQVGDATAEVTTTKNLLVQLHTPRFLVEGDEVVLSANVRNALSTEQQVDFELIVPSALLGSAKAKPADDSGNLRLTARRLVKAGSDTRIDWPLRVLRAGRAAITVKAIAKDDSDAMQVTVPVLPFGVERERTWAGVLRGSEKRSEMSFTVPEKIDPPQTGFELSLSPGPVGAMLDALPMLMGYPYGCTEQSMSRFYPTVLAANTLRKLGINLEALAGRPRGPAPKFADRFDLFQSAVFDSREMNRMAQAGLQRLYNYQHEDGGWGWWRDDASSPYMTAYVLTGLQLTRQAGHEVRPRVLDYAYHYLFESIYPEGRRRPAAAEEHRAETDAYVALVLSWAVAHKGKPGGIGENRDDREGQGHLNQLRQRLFQDRNRLNPYGQALLALALHHAGDSKRARNVLGNLLRLVKRNPTQGTAHIPTASEGWWSWYNSEVETNAWTLRAVLAIDPSSQLASGLAQWLALHRDNGTHWRSTRDSALAVAALADYVRTRKDSGADCRVTIRLDGKSIREVSIGFKDLLAPDGRLFLDATKLTPGKHTVTLEKAGRGELQFSGRFRTFARQNAIQAAGKGLRIEREYVSLGADGSKRQPLPADAAVAVGDIIEVALTITADNNYDYLAFTDPRPAGCEPVELQSGGVWLDGSWANVELRDQGVIFFLPSLARGKHVLRYRLRAETPGAFRVLGASGFAMYAPQIQASSAAGRLGIR
jgi:uncharacterized protein YfaS (alpha-2-macroglobulin family)